MPFPLAYRNRAQLMSSDPDLVDALDDICDHLSGVMEQTNSAPKGAVTMPPPQVNKLTVTGSQGIFDAKIDDNNSPVVRNVQYFVDYADNPSFNNKRTISLGASRNWRGSLGNRRLYFQAYSQHPNTPSSKPIPHSLDGNTPSVVEGGGLNTGPELQPSSGSGTSSGAQPSDGGFGQQPFRGPTRPLTWQQKR